MSRLRNFLLLFATLFLFWLALNGNLSRDVVWAGLVAVLAVALLFRNSLAVFSEFRATPRAFWAAACYLVFFLAELFKSNISLARIVLSPGLPLRPGIVKARTRLKSRMGRLLLTNSITLTPGTLTVHLAEDQLYVHWVTVDATDIETATAAIVTGFERYLEVMYG